mmetsp:Transcript_14325/g.37178  ORF Transcript_14325/g.37178 Transcript_14325/m.37178 type:complete len:214 (-) Transcript_14325:1052-1693(-)
MTLVQGTELNVDACLASCLELHTTPTNCERRAPRHATLPTASQPVPYPSPHAQCGDDLSVVDLRVPLDSRGELPLGEILLAIFLIEIGLLLQGRLVLGDLLFTDLLVHFVLLRGLLRLLLGLVQLIHRRLDVGCRLLEGLLGKLDLLGRLRELLLGLLSLLLLLGFLGFDLLLGLRVALGSVVSLCGLECRARILQRLLSKGLVVDGLVVDLL